MDWPISWQKVKDSSDNTGGGSGSGLPVIDLSKYALPEALPAMVQITDVTDIEVLETLLLEEKPFIVKTTHVLGENMPNATFYIFMNYMDVGAQKGFVGTVYVWSFAILYTEQGWVLEMFVPERISSNNP